MKLIIGAIQADADICNMLTVDAPVSGVHVGPGLHVAIPVDWQTRCVNGQAVPGCNYHAPLSDGTMWVSTVAIANSAIPANVVGANATAVFNFRNKVSASAVSSPP